MRICEIKDFVIDSVPEGNFVRFIARADVDAEKFSKRLGLSVEKVHARLEDGFMILPHDAEKNNLEHVADMKKLSLSENYSL